MNKKLYVVYEKARELVRLALAEDLQVECEYTVDEYNGILKKEAEKFIKSYKTCLEDYSEKGRWDWE